MGGQIKAIEEKFREAVQVGEAAAETAAAGAALAARASRVQRGARRDAVGGAMTVCDAERGHSLVVCMVLDLGPQTRSSAGFFSTTNPPFSSSARHQRTSECAGIAFRGA